MPKISKTICAALLVVLNYANAAYTNLLYGANSTAYPGTFSTTKLASATDRFITYYKNGNGWDQFTSGTFDQFSAAVVPAPGALALLGVAGLAGGRRRRA